MLRIRCVLFQIQCPHTVHSFIHFFKLPSSSNMDQLSSLQEGPGTEPEPETGTARTEFPGTENRNRTAGTVFCRAFPRGTFRTEKGNWNCSTPKPSPNRTGAALSILELEQAKLLVDEALGRKKACKHEYCGPVGFGTAPGLSPGTNPAGPCDKPRASRDKLGVEG